MELSNPATLPPLYARWLAEALGAPIPGEPRAVCDPCVMCSPPPGPVEPFHPGVKCCSYWPSLPSFLVGQALADEREGAAPGQAIVRRFIAEDRCATPLGINPSPAVAERYDKVGDQRFGVDPALLCPYFDPAASNCRIWPHRDVVCATYFCLYERRAVGRQLWRALQRLLLEVERVLVTWSLLELAPGAEAVAELLDAAGNPRRLEWRELRGWVEPDGRIEADFARQIWGRWRGREQEYFLACAERVRELDWARLRAIGGARLEVLRRRVERALRQRQEQALPDVLCPGLFDVVEPEGSDQVLLHSEEISLDPLPVSRAVAEALSLFDGRPVAAAVALARERHGVELDGPLLLRLVDAGVLGPPDGHDVPPAERPTGPLEPDARLRLFQGFRAAAIGSAVGSDEGRPSFTVTVGHKEIFFDEPELFAFGQGLHRHRHGFRAGDACAWGDLRWERVRELLETLLEAGLLQRLP